MQGRNGARTTIDEQQERFPSLPHFFADGCYRSEALVEFVGGYVELTIEITKRPDGAEGFVLIAIRWAVERTFASLNRLSAQSDLSNAFVSLGIA